MQAAARSMLTCGEPLAGLIRLPHCCRAAVGRVQSLAGEPGMAATSMPIAYWVLAHHDGVGRRSYVLQLFDWR